MLPEIPKPSKALILLADLEGGLSKIARDLQDNGVCVTKVAFCFSDYYYKLHGIPCVDYDDVYANFASWLRNYVITHKIDTLILYNEIRPYNEVGWSLAQELGLECLVFELGLLRPNWASIYSSRFHHFTHLKELWNSGVCASFSTPKIQDAPVMTPPDSRIKITKMSVRLVLNRLYSITTRRFRFHHDKRSVSLRRHFPPAMKSIFRFYTRSYQKKYDVLFLGEWKQMYYICPLQVYYDAQITHKSHYKTIEAFIKDVSESFIAHAPLGTRLVFKMHPMDRGYKDYAEFISQLNEKHHTNRLIYVDRIHLPTALEHALGCVTINSSVGLSALMKGTPTIVMGEAIYNLSGVTYQGKLDTFWMERSPVQREQLELFLDLIKITTQAQGVIYQRTLNCCGHAQIQYPPLFRHLFSENLPHP